MGGELAWCGKMGLVGEKEGNPRRVRRKRLSVGEQRTKTRKVYAIVMLGVSSSSIVGTL